MIGNKGGIPRPFQKVVRVTEAEGRRGSIIRAYEYIPPQFVYTYICSYCVQSKEQVFQTTLA